MTAPSPYSEHNGHLQQAWDSTSLRALMFCPRYYQYSILEGWMGSSIDLEFGILAHKAFEVWAKARLEGKDKWEATLDAVEWALKNSGDYRLSDTETDPHHGGKIMVWTPWGGTYRTQWHCLGTEKYKNPKGNAAKCPYSHKGKWFETSAPTICGECGSDIEIAERWIPIDPAKDRFGLVRMVAWWADEQPEEFGTGVDPYAFPDGTPAVELSGKVPLPFVNKYGEPYILCVHIDSIATFGQEHFVRDHKTTKHAPDKKYFSGFMPHVQMDTYDLFGNLMYPDLDMKGVMIDAAQLLQSGARFGKGVTYRSDTLRQEYLEDLQFWLNQAEQFAEARHWPMNRANCWLCPFKGVCSKEPVQRGQFLLSDFTQRHWNPLEER